MTRFSASLFCLVALLAAAPLSAQEKDQEAHKLLKKVERKYKGNKAMKIDYRQTIEDGDGGLISETSGRLYLHDSKFKLEVLDQVMISDGKTLWLYFKDDNEVTISDMDPEQQAIFNPSDIFTLYEKDFQYRLDGFANLDNKEYQVVRFTPNDKNEAFHTIRLYVAKNNYEIVQAMIIDKEQQKLIFRIRSLEQNISLADDFFRFSLKDHPGIRVTDTR